MALTMRWVGDEENDRVAETRWMCYALAARDALRHRENIRLDPRPKPGDFLLAEEGGQPVGTATSLSMTMWIRGAAMACQGVADVGTIKTARRRGGSGPGVASAIMREMLRLARQRGQVVSALMPFRASFYEHFGYGIVERRAEWTIPLSILPAGDCQGWRHAGSEDRDAQAAQWQAAVEAGQCDVERSADRWRHRLLAEEAGMTFVDRPDPAGPVRASAFLAPETRNGQSLLGVAEWSADSLPSFLGMLRFLASLRDQYSTLLMNAPANLPLNRLLREPQIAHRPVAHATAEVRPYTRMQLRILDHRRYLEALKLPPSLKGKVAVAIDECEGETSRFAVSFESGHASVIPGNGADFQCPDRIWASIATGEIAATRAVQLGMAAEHAAGAAALLDGLAAGPIPFSREYF